MTFVTAARPKHGAGTVFARHFGEMTVAMIAGMGVYLAVVAAIAAAAEGTVDSVRLGQPELFALGMATSMTLPMVWWMRRRGHGWRNGVEMSLAMYLPAFFAIACYWAGATAAGSICPLACVTMLPAMLVAMVARVDEYTH